MGETCKHIVWARSLLSELEVQSDEPTTLYVDNQGAQTWGEGGIRNAKHVSVKFNYVKELSDQYIIRTQYCPSA